jgi:ATP-binding cassette subfamily B protein RaxB
MMFFVFRMFFVERLNSCVNYIMELRRIQTHAERIEEVMTDEAGWEAGEQREKPPYIPPDGSGLSIELKDVWFRYGDDSPWILQGLNMTIEAGETVAITGPSGCGKTTLMSIMLGLLTPVRGEVLIGGRNLASITSTDYAKAIGVVMQDDMMFQGTVAQNICFFEAPIDMARVQAAAAMANIAADIESMPMKYYSVLAEGAGDISGGQRQRIFIARALYHQPKLLFLDEATSHLDMASEKLVAQAVRDLAMTRILIAHRAETIASASRVYRLDPARGDLVETTA